MFKGKNTKVLVLEIIVIMIALVGITFGLSYVMDAIRVNIGAANLAVDYSGNLTLPSTNLEPIADSSVSTNTTDVIRVNFTVRGKNTNPNDRPIIYDIILTDLNISCQLKNGFLKWQLKKNGSSLSNGSFSPEFDIMKDDKLYLTTIQQDLPNSSQTADSYELVIWISEACAGDVSTCNASQDQSSMLNKRISGKVQTILYTDSKKALVRETGSAIDCGAEPNAPKLMNGMVPITYNEDKWVVADTNNSNNSWYNYDEKKWANAVLLESGSYTTVGQEVPESAVKAYYVWIPRYKYKVWNINKKVGVDNYDAYHTGIEILFESGTSSTGTITCNPYDFTITEGNGLNETCSGSNGEYYTHPAFTFGNDELEGFWVGKFHTTGSTGNLTIKPNIEPIINLQVTEFANEIYSFIPNHDVVDSHMMKNMEWGAVAYLTNSEYGECNNGECNGIYYNSYSDYNNGAYMTGCGVNLENEDNFICEPYNTTNGQLASTTGNIYGVYDMATYNGTFVMGIGSMDEGEYIIDLGSESIPLVNNDDKYCDKYRYMNWFDLDSYNSTLDIVIEYAKLGDAFGENTFMTRGGLDNVWYVSLWSPVWADGTAFYPGSNFILRGIEGHMFSFDPGLLGESNGSARAVLAVY